MAVKKQKIIIENMKCASCALLIDGDLEDLKGVKKAQTKFAKGECEVEFEENEVSVKKIVETIKKTGYLAKEKSLD